MSVSNNLSETEKQIFEAIEKNDVALVKVLIPKIQKLNFLDEFLLTPLQTACVGVNKEIVQILIDQGADVNFAEHQHGCTALHFAGISGNMDICHILLLAGANTETINSLGRTPAQQASFDRSYSCAAFIKNFIPKSDIDYYTVVHGLQTKPSLPSFIANLFHKFVLQANIHPMKISLVLRRHAGLSEHLNEVNNVLELMCIREIKRGIEKHDVMAFKLHYLSYVVKHIMKLKESLTIAQNEGTTKAKKFDFVQALACKLLKPNEDGQLEDMENFLKECIKDFPVRKCVIIYQMVSGLTKKDSSSALMIIKEAINGKRRFVENTMCHTCGEEDPAKTCSKCKSVQYCNEDCQRLHWRIHKKICVCRAPSELLVNVN